MNHEIDGSPKFVRRKGNTITVVENMHDLAADIHTSTSNFVFGVQAFNEFEQPHLESSKAEVNVLTHDTRILSGEITFSPIDHPEYPSATLAKIYQYIAMDPSRGNSSITFEAFGSHDPEITVKTDGTEFHIIAQRDGESHTLQLIVSIDSSPEHLPKARDQLRTFIELWADLHDGIIQNPLVEDSPYPIVDVSIYIDDFNADDAALAVWQSLSEYETRQQESGGRLPQLLMSEINPKSIAHVMGGYDEYLLINVLNKAIAVKTNPRNGMLSGPITQGDLLSAAAELQHRK